MNERTQDIELLRRFSRGEQVAFNAPVRRHLDLVDATALRKVEDAGAAQQVAQNVFADLARGVPQDVFAALARDGSYNTGSPRAPCQ